jgi:hypothetical protein
MIGYRGHHSTQLHRSAKERQTVAAGHWTTRRCMAGNESSYKPEVSLWGIDPERPPIRHGRVDRTGSASGTSQDWRHPFASASDLHVR